MLGFPGPIKKAYTWPDRPVLFDTLEQICIETSISVEHYLIWIPPINTIPKESIH